VMFSFLVDIFHDGLFLLNELHLIFTIVSPFPMFFIFNGRVFVCPFLTLILDVFAISMNSASIFGTYFDINVKGALLFDDSNPQLFSGVNAASIIMFSS